MLLKYKVKANEADNWLWKGLTKCSCSTKVMYQVIVEAASDEEEVHFLWKKSWWKVVPYKISTFS